MFWRGLTVPSPNADHIMYTDHITGKAYVQTLRGDEARRRIGLAHLAASLRGHPLKFSMEPE
jgi:ATP-dependent Clp protease adapter protein ClpS